jgi:hypothetical protein
MQHALLALQRLPQPSQIGAIILLAKETGTAVVAALHEMQRHTVKMNSGASGHEGSLAETEPDPFPPTFRLRPCQAALTPFRLSGPIFRRLALDSSNARELMRHVDDHRFATLSEYARAILA